jgi:hypothetical protein
MRQLIFLAGVILALSSCYSVRIASVNGVPEPDPSNLEAGYYRLKKVTEIDTTVNLGLLANQVIVLEDCASGGFQIVEYRVTLGAALLSGITFGKHRKVKVKYVCLKEEN